MVENIDNAASGIADAILDIASQEIEQTINKELIGNSNLLKQIKYKIKSYLKTIEEYGLRSSSIGYGTIGSELKNLELRKDIIYSNFFELQNLINAYLGQKIVVTYVYVDENTGKREIRVMDNNIEHLAIVEGVARGNPFHKLSYIAETHYKNLKNSLSEKDNQALQETAMAVEYRYNTYKHRVLWYYPNAWQGYRFPTKGPINEAFVNMYIHEIQLTKGLEGNINTFILDSSYGAIKADATKGFLIGDVQKNGVQYAVKGKFASPQGVKEIYKELKKMEEEGFSDASFQNFLHKFLTEELKPDKYKPQIQPLVKRSIDGIINYQKRQMTSRLDIDIPI